MLLVGECAVYATAWAWPNCLGLGVEPIELTKNIQGKYGTSGEEQFTAAIDLAQTMVNVFNTKKIVKNIIILQFECCGVESANEYDTSLWRLQALGPSLAIPLTCCKLDNFNDTRSYLDPHPINSSLCQALERGRHQNYRHLKVLKLLLII